MKQTRDIQWYYTKNLKIYRRIIHRNPTTMKQTGWRRHEFRPVVVNLSSIHFLSYQYDS